MNFVKSLGYADSEQIVHVALEHIIDPTLLRALGLIKNENDVEAYFIDGRSTVPLMIKFKKKQQEQEVEVFHPR